ncbi:MAG TPA: hypothetical protein VK781_01710 [Solirubrobacteraceae bacterium]|nr:hypothetical protein [Solirubrobacteraceae bacterium]
MGSDPAPSLTELKRFIASGQLHYVLLSSAGQAGGPGGDPGGPGQGSVKTQARDAWIRSHGTVVRVSGVSSNTGMTLYRFSTGG